MNARTDAEREASVDVAPVEADMAVDDAESTSAVRPDHRRPRGWVLVLPWVVAVLAIGVALVSALQWRTLATHQNLVDNAAVAARAFMETVTTWDSTDGMDDELATWRAFGTGPFLDEIEQTFGGDELLLALQDAGLAATGEVQESFVQRFEDGRAEVFVVVEITYRSSEHPQGLRPMVWPTTIELQRDGDQWLVHRVTMPNSDQIGQLMAPTG